jgi:predicted P-loop ATPase
MSNLNDNNDKDKSSQTVPGHWTELLQCSSKGAINNLYNATIIMSHDEKFKDVFYYNEMTSRPCVRRPNGKDTWHLVDDVYYEMAKKYIQQFYIKTMSLENIRGAILLACHDHKFHPVKEDIESVVWDQVPRIETWLPVYMGAEDTPYHQVIGSCFIISMIARIYDPGCQCDYMLIFEGPQGIGKSTAFRILGGEYFSDCLNELNTKDAKMHVVSFWLHELAEMHAILSTRSEAAQVKSFLTRTKEIFRPPYGVMDVERPRQCVFAGTTNQERYLRDDTGNRRFWPAKCGTIDTEALKKDRSQLFAEALVKYREGWHWWPPREFEESFIKPQQASRLEFDEWQNIISRQLDLGNNVFDVRNATIADVYKWWISTGDSRLSNADSQRIAKVLRGLGATSRRTKKGFVWDLTAGV